MTDDPIINDIAEPSKLLCYAFMTSMTPESCGDMLNDCLNGEALEHLYDDDPGNPGLRTIMSKLVGLGMLALMDEMAERQRSQS